MLILIENEKLSNENTKCVKCRTRLALPDGAYCGACDEYYEDLRQKQSEELEIISPSKIHTRCEICRSPRYIVIVRRRNDKRVWILAGTKLYGDDWTQPMRGYVDQETGRCEFCKPKG